MKVVNADYGIDTIACDGRKRPKWYHWHRFPILPIFSYRSADENNESNFTLSWFNIRIWSMMSPDIEIGITIENVGAYIYFRIPYIKCVVWFLWFPSSWNQKLWRG